MLDIYIIHEFWCLQRIVEAETRSRESQDKKDAKDEKMEALLRKVDADFLAMIKEAEDDESKVADVSPLDQTNTEDK